MAALLLCDFIILFLKCLYFSPENHYIPSIAHIPLHSSQNPQKNGGISLEKGGHFLLMLSCLMNIVHLVCPRWSPSSGR